MPGQYPMADLMGLTPTLLDRRQVRIYEDPLSIWDPQRLQVQLPNDV